MGVVEGWAFPQIFTPLPPLFAAGAERQVAEVGGQGGECAHGQRRCAHTGGWAVGLVLLRLLESLWKTVDTWAGVVRYARVLFL